MTEQLQPAFVLHTRPFRDTSLLVDVLSQDHGRLALVARGQRQATGRARQPLSPFAELLLSWRGRGDVKTLTNADYHQILPPLAGRRLYSGLYANELLIRLVPQADPCPAIFHAYQRFLQVLCANADEAPEVLEPPLRRFEMALLEALGYGIDFTGTADSNAAISAVGEYRYSADEGFFPVVGRSEGVTVDAAIFSGADLLCLAADNFSLPATRRAAKRLLRQALAPHLGGRPLKSRELFR